MGTGNLRQETDPYSLLSISLQLWPPSFPFQSLRDFSILHTSIEVQCACPGQGLSIARHRKSRIYTYAVSERVKNSGDELRYTEQVWIMCDKHRLLPACARRCAGQFTCIIENLLCRPADWLFLDCWTHRSLIPHKKEAANLHSGMKPTIASTNTLREGIWLSPFQTTQGRLLFHWSFLLPSQSGWVLLFVTVLTGCGFFFFFWSQLFSFFPHTVIQCYWFMCMCWATICQELQPWERRRNKSGLFSLRHSWGVPKGVMLALQMCGKACGWVPDRWVKRMWQWSRGRTTFPFSREWRPTD